MSPYLELKATAKEAKQKLLAVVSSICKIYDNRVQKVLMLRSNTRDGLQKGPIQFFAIWTGTLVRLQDVPIPSMPY